MRKTHDKPGNPREEEKNITQDHNLTSLNHPYLELVFPNKQTAYKITRHKAFSSQSVC